MYPISKFLDRINGCKKFVLLSTILLLSASLYGGDDDKLKKGSSIPAEDAVLISTSGDTSNLLSYKENGGLIVIFSCNTCPFVVGNENFEGWEGQYNELYEKAQAAEMGMVLINSNEAKRDGVDSFEEMRKHAIEEQYEMPYLMDEGHVVADAFYARTTPHVFVFDKHGYLIYQGTIDNTWDTGRENDEKYLESVIQDLSLNLKVKQESTSPKGCSIKRVKQ